MKRQIGHLGRRLVGAIACLCILLVAAACSSRSHEGFAIYLTRGDVPPAQMQTSSQVEIAEQPVISANDIIAYDSSTHEITLTKEAFDRIQSMKVPVRGTSFVVCVDRKPEYWGAFWTPISSLSFDGVTIMGWPVSQASNIIKLELGYPGPSFYGGADPRNNAEVMKSLRQAGKLKTTTADQLPRSMKGYELYSWLEKGQWQFTLITGTNRNKWVEEIVSKAVTDASDQGWVNIHVAGVEDAKAVLSRVPQGEYVTWLGGLREQTLQGGPSLGLPPASIVESITAYARQCGLEFTVPAP
jgi:hypothetical protein